MPWRPEDRGTSRVYDAGYRRKRTAALKRANWRCEIRIPGICIGAASQADHINQAANDPNHDHLRAACKPCHAHVTAQQGRGYRKRPPPTDPQSRPTTSW